MVILDMIRIYQVYHGLPHHHGDIGHDLLWGLPWFTTSQRINHSGSSNSPVSQELDGLELGCQKPIAMMDGYNFNGAKMYKAGPAIDYCDVVAKIMMASLPTGND